MVFRHINYHVSILVDKIMGIYNLKVKANIQDKDNPSQVSCMMTLRECLYQFWTFEDGSSMFAEIHQCGPMSMVEVVVSDTPEAEKVLSMMNK